MRRYTALRKTAVIASADKHCYISPMKFTPDIDIEVQTHFLPAESQPNQARFVFAYTITITNNSALAVKLLTRTWRICDANDKKQEVHGEGVVGQQPPLAKWRSFSIHLGCYY